MSGQEVRCRMQALGISRGWLADHLGVDLRTVQRWMSDGPRSGRADEVLSLLEVEALDQVAEHVEAFRARPSVTPVLMIEPGDWPESWQRAVAWRVRQHVPTLRVL